MMSDPSPMTLAKAQAAASRIADTLRPFAHRVEISGSIRRCRPTVGDIDLVIEAIDKAALLDRVKQRGTIVTGDSPTAQNTIVRLGEYQLDLFFSRAADHDLFAPLPATWGTVLLCRTGSRSHNTAIASRANRCGLHWDPYKGLLNGGNEIVASETEEDIYKALGLSYLDPVGQREHPTFP